MGFFGSSLLAEEQQHPIGPILGSTTLSGFVDTSVIWGGVPVQIWPELVGGSSFENRANISNSPTVLTSYPDQIEPQPGAQAISAVSLGHTAWWTWQAPDRGMYVLDAGPEPQSALAVYSGTVGPQLKLIANNTAALVGSGSLAPQGSLGWRLGRYLGVDVEAGQVLQIGVDYALAHEFLGTLPAAAPVPVGTQLRVVGYFVPVPANDHFAERKLLNGSTWLEKGSTVAARPEAGEPNPDQRTVWYRWNAPKSGLARLSTTPVLPPADPQATTILTNLPASRYDWPDGIEAGRELWLVQTNQATGSGGPWGSTGVTSTRSTDGRTGSGTRSIDSLQWIEVDPVPLFTPQLSVFLGDSLASLQPLGTGTNLSFDVEEGREYAVQLASSLRAMGEQEIHLVVVTSPNDAFAERLTLVGAAVMASGNNAGASMDSGEPLQLGRSVWWSWTAPEAGEVSATVASSDFLPRLVVFRGDSVGHLNPVADMGGTVRWVAESGITYTLAIASVDERSGSYNLSLNLKRFAPKLLAREARTVIDGSFRLELAHLYGRPVTLLYSTDLYRWQPLWTGRFNADDAVVRDFSTGLDPRFYRLVLVEPE